MKNTGKLDEIIRLSSELNTVQDLDMLLDKILTEARNELDPVLGKPVNNAFFIYWNHFYGMVPRVYQKVAPITDINKAITSLKTLNIE